MSDDDQHVNYKGHPIPEDRLPSLFHRLMRTRFCLLAWMFIVSIVSAVSAIFLTLYVTVLGLLRIVGHRKLRRFSDWSIRSWFTLMPFLFRYVFGINTRIFGDGQPFDKHCLIILNHRCHLDWLFFWNVSVKLGNLSWWMVMLKNTLKALPIVGWVMQYRTTFIFLSRDWKIDKDEFLWKLKYLNATGEPYQYLMFPEGRDLTTRHKILSDKFARENNLPYYNYALHPRSRGFIYAIRLLREGKLESVYDITVGYPDIFAATEVELIQNSTFPREVHYHVKRYDISDLPESDEELEVWLRKRWEEKEERLRLFYMHRQFIQLSCDTEHVNGGDHVIPSPEVIMWFPWLQLLEGVMFLLVLFCSSLLWCWYSWVGVCAFIFSCAYNWYFCTRQSRMDYYIMNHFRHNCEDFLSLPEEKKVT